MLTDEDLGVIESCMWGAITEIEYDSAHNKKLSVEDYKLNAELICEYKAVRAKVMSMMRMHK